MSLTGLLGNGVEQFRTYRSYGSIFFFDWLNWRPVSQAVLQTLQYQLLGFWGYGWGWVSCMCGVFVVWFVCNSLSRSPHDSAALALHTIGWYMVWFSYRAGPWGEVVHVHKARSNMRKVIVSSEACQDILTVYGLHVPRS